MPANKLPPLSVCEGRKRFTMELEDNSFISSGTLCKCGANKVIRRSGGTKGCIRCGTTKEAA